MGEAGVIELVRKEIKRAGSLRALAREWSVSPCYISDTCNGRRAPGPAILEPLGLERRTIVTYERQKVTA